jgi:transposase-like protein
MARFARASQSDNRENEMAEATNGLEAALDELLKGKKPEEIVGQDGLLKQLTKALLERAMNAELTHHLGYEKWQPEGRVQIHDQFG